VALKHWQDAPAEDWPALIESIDPDWASHFRSPEQGLSHYEEYNDKYPGGEPLVANTLLEYYGEDEPEEDIYVPGNPDFEYDRARQAEIDGEAE